MSEMQIDKRVARRIRHAYVLALSIIAIATISAFMVENEMMERFEGSSAALHVVGEQRTLSHRLVLFAADAVNAPNYTIEAMALNNLAQVKSAMVKEHESLLSRIRPEDGARGLGPEIDRVFFDAPYNLNPKFMRYMNRVDAFLASEGEAMKARYNAMYFEAIGPLGTALDVAVEQLEKDTMADVATMRTIRMAMAVVVMFALVGEWMFIFRPLARTVEQKTRALEEARNAVAHAASHDPLTDLPNRRMLEHVIDTMQSQAQRQGRPLTVCHVDLDRFKEVNDTLGHAVGDKVLQHAVTVLRNATRGSDFIARVGGDEFVIVDCTFGGYEGATVMAERIVERMARPFEIDGHVCRIGASIGIALCDDHDAPDIDALMCRADLALYYAKERGRGQVQPYSEAARTSFEQRVARSAA